MRDSTPDVGSFRHSAPGATTDDATPSENQPRTVVGRALRDMHLRALDLLAARRSQRLVDDLDLPDDATVSDLRDLIEERTGRPVRVMFVDRAQVRDATGKSHAKAAWLPGEEDDVLLVDSAAWYGGRDHNLRHEFAHMLLGHSCELGLTEHLEIFTKEGARRYMESRPVPSLARGQWTSPRERETELVATMLGRRLRASVVSPPRPSDSLADARARHMLGIIDEPADGATDSAHETEERR